MYAYAQGHSPLFCLYKYQRMCFVSRDQLWILSLVDSGEVLEGREPKQLSAVRESRETGFLVDFISEEWGSASPRRGYQQRRVGVNLYWGEWVGRMSERLSQVYLTMEINTEMKHTAKLSINCLIIVSLQVCCCSTLRGGGWGGSRHLVKLVSVLLYDGLEQRKVHHEKHTLEMLERPRPPGICGRRSCKKLHVKRECVCLAWFHHKIKLSWTLTLKYC